MEHPLVPTQGAAGTRHTETGVCNNPPWQALNQFVDSLQACAPSGHVPLLAVRSIQPGLDADVLFWYFKRPGRITFIVNRPNLAPARCQRMVEKLLEQHGNDSEILWSEPAAWAGESSIRLRSAIVVRLGQAPAWLAAFRIRPDKAFTHEDASLLGLARGILLSHQARVRGKLTELIMGLVRSFMATIEAKDPYTAGHSERVARIGAILGRKLNLNRSEINDLYLAGLIHDIGKIGVQDHVLQKPGALTEAEFGHVQEHVLIGDRIISSIRQFQRLRAGVRNHHERFDGGGYPDHLQGNAIPRLARILTIADCCDAMMSPRRYRPPMTPPQIDEIFLAESGKQFDPEIVDCFMACRDEIYPPIFQRGLGDSALDMITQMVDALGEESFTRYPSLIVPEEQPSTAGACEA
jgi:HD-GYP domain-containing protein (c-di-GMP phosphodiesterase class II)